MKDNVEDNYTTKQLRDRYEKALKRYNYISKIYNKKQNDGSDMTSPKNKWLVKKFKEANNNLVYLANLMQKETHKFQDINQNLYSRSFEHEVNYPKSVDNYKQEKRKVIGLINNQSVLNSNVHHTKKTTTMYQYRQIIWLCFTIVVILMTLKQLAMPSGGMFMSQVSFSPLRLIFILILVAFIVTSTFDVVLRFYENVTKRTNDMIY